MTTQDDLDRRLAALEDIEQIRAVKAAYWRAVDFRAVEAAIGCVTEDVKIDFQGVPPCDGHEAFRAILDAGARRAGAYDTHHGCNPVIRLTSADTATAEWSIGYRGIDATQRLVIRMAGEYHDSYRRTHQGWRIAAMTMRQVSFAMRYVGADGRQIQTSLGVSDLQAFAQE